MGTRRITALAIAFALALWLCPSLAMATDGGALRAGTVDVEDVTMQTMGDLPEDLRDGGYQIFFDGKPGNWIQYYVDGKNGTITPNAELCYVSDGAVTKVPTDLYVLKWNEQWYDEAAGEEVRVPVLPPFGVQNDGIGHYFEVTAYATDEGGLTGTSETFTIFPADKQTFNYHAKKVVIEGAREAFVVPTWHDGYKMGVGDNVSLKVFDNAANAEYREIDPKNYTATYYKRTPGPYEDIMSGPHYDEKVWIEENPLPGFPTEPGTYFVVVEGNSPYYGSTIIDFDIVSNEVSIEWLGPDKTMYTDSTKNARLRFMGFAGTEGTDWSIGVEVGILGKDGTSWDVKFTEGNEYSYDARTHVLIFDGEKIGATLAGNYDKFDVRASAVDTTGAVLGKDTINVELHETIADYMQEGDSQLLPGWVGHVRDSYSVYVENSKHPNGIEQQYTVESVEIVSQEPDEQGKTVVENVRKVQGDNGEYRWEYDAVSYGTATLEVTYTDLKGEKQSYTFEVTVTPTIYELVFDMEDRIELDGEQKVAVEVRKHSAESEGYTVTPNTMFRWYYEGDAVQVLDKNGEVVGGRVGAMKLTDACYGSTAEFTVKRISNLETGLTLRADVLDENGESIWSGERGFLLVNPMPTDLGEPNYQLFIDGQPMKWALCYADGENGTIDPNVELFYVNGEIKTPIPAELYKLEWQRFWWDGEQQVSEGATPPFGVNDATYRAVAYPSENSGFENQTSPIEIMVWDKYSFDFVGKRVYLDGAKEENVVPSWHSGFSFACGEDVKLVVEDAAVNSEGAVIDPKYYTATYYKRTPGPYDAIMNDPDYNEKVWVQKNPMRDMPTLPGTYFVVVEGINGYHGSTIVDFDITGEAPAPVETEWKRLEGDVVGDAYDTMTEVVSEGWKSSDTVVIARFDGYWDALAASGLAGSEGAPVLLTDTGSLSPKTRKVIESLGAKKAYICGGTDAVSKGVEDEIAGMGLSVERFKGDMAFNTAEEISAKAKANLGAKCDTCVIATIDGFYDSLSVAPAAYSLGMPVYLTDWDFKLADSTIAAIKAAGYKKAVIVGGKDAVKEGKDGVEGQLSLGTSVKSFTRLAGDNAWETSEKIAKWGLDNGLGAETVGVADGNGYWDALTGAPLIGLKGGSLVLVPHDGKSSDGKYYFSYNPHCIENFIAKNAAWVEQGYVFGGPAAVSDIAFEACKAATAMK